MTFESVKEMFDILPYEKQSEAADFISFLFTENQKKQKKEINGKFPFVFFRRDELYCGRF